MALDRARRVTLIISPFVLHADQLHLAGKPHMKPAALDSFSASWLFGGIQSITHTQVKTKKRSKRKDSAL
jgi:hypothetical protein